MTYSLKEVVTDGRLTAPRYVQHLAKIGVHLAASLIVVGGFARLPSHALHLLLAATLGGPLLWLLIAGHENIWPSDLQPLTQWQHIADWFTDFSLSCVPVIGALLLTGHLVGALLLGALSLGAYVYCHRDARP
jgi:hypothetical protein